MVELQYFESSDFPQLIAWITSAAFLLQWSGPWFSYPLDDGQLEQYLSGANTPDAKTLAFRVLDTGSRKIVGHISLGQIDRKNQSARLGKVLVGDPAMRGQGIGQSMVTKVLGIAFDELKLHRVSLGVFDFNQSAIAAYEKVGFTSEGVLRDVSKIGEQYWSSCEMSILADEWERVKPSTSA